MFSSFRRRWRKFAQDRRYSLPRTSISLPCYLAWGVISGTRRGQWTRRRRYGRSTGLKVTSVIAPLCRNTFGKSARLSTVNMGSSHKAIPGGRVYGWARSLPPLARPEKTGTYASDARTTEADGAETNRRKREDDKITLLMFFREEQSLHFTGNSRSC